MVAEMEPELKKARKALVVEPVAGVASHHHIEEWYEENKAQFSPPICNKLMYKGQLTVMFVGGPNTRKDFHLEEGSEFFYQMKGDMELPTVQNGKRKLVKIREGQLYCLPSRIPHSPQRPNTGSLGLVIERRREPGEMDGLVFYKDFESCDKVLWERFFKCEDLGKDLVPVVKAFKEFEASEAAKEDKTWPDEDRPIQQDRETEVPPPFYLADLLFANAKQLEAGQSVPLFGTDHPDDEFQESCLVGGKSTQKNQIFDVDTYLYQVKGSASIKVATGSFDLAEGCCCIVRAGETFDVSRPKGSIGMVVRQDPTGNKTGGAEEDGEEEEAVVDEAEEPADGE
eukprot:TRINITY_DN15724_c0_g1_i1.p1 TRINITY_DN15724_c0_g1~~TRINITY_DN15724_c0_g1_i1.p1  ORF type:complete len:341 (+),score=70.59 TRINITY_DN15724_c0_g1_i1:77-1099(+)